MPSTTIRLASDVQFDSIVDGPGIRSLIWVQGCTHNCFECHNPHTHDLNGGELFEIDDLVDAIINNPLQSGVTISGGDPLLQVESVLELAKKLKAHHKNIWIYTGFIYEDLISIANPKHALFIELFNYVDVLVDGPFILALNDPLIVFKGSTNQRIIDLPKTLSAKQIVLYA